MTKRKRQPPREPKAVANGTDPGPVERAIDSAAAKRLPVDLTVKVSRQPLRMTAGSRLTVQQGDDPAQAEILVRDPDNVWHGVLLPAGELFEFRKAGPKVDLWTPPGTKR